MRLFLIDPFSLIRFQIPLILHPRPQPEGFSQMKLLLFLTALPALALAQGAGDLCGPTETVILGICESTDWCNENQGYYYSGFCPNAPDYVKCCQSPRCGSNGSCQDTEYFDCAGAGGHWAR